MSGVMASVDQRTQLAGRNRLELLMFRLHGKQLYGINVFKVREVLQCPPLSVVPQSHPVVRGISNIRGQTISIMDLSMAIGGRPIEDIQNAFVIISEYNRSVQGFLVREVDRIINLNWKDMLPPPTGAAGSSYLTAVTYINEKMVEVIDVERILAEVVGAKEHVSDDFLSRVNLNKENKKNLILVSDDSMVARKQVTRTLEQDLNLETITAKDGKEAIELLKSWADNKDPQLDRLALVVSDIEMPEMDGYTLTKAMRQDSSLRDIYILLHTSLNGAINTERAKQSGANAFLTKFVPDDLANEVIKGMQHCVANAA